MYITYAEYQAMGGTLDETAFTRFANRACALIDSETKNRVAAMAVVPDKVKYLCFELIEYSNNAATVAKSNVASRSQTAGSVSESESYVTAKTANEQSNEMCDLVSDYLSGVKDDNGTPLLYKGVAW